MFPLEIFSMRGLARALAALCVSTAAAHAQATAVVELDHATDGARLIVQHDGRPDTTVLERHAHVKVARGTLVDVRVVNTNTALYVLRKSVEQTPVPELAPVRSFLDRATPYVPGLPSLMERLAGGSDKDGKGEKGSGGKSRGAGDSEARAQRLAEAEQRMRDAMGATDRSLRAVDQALFGTGGLRDYSTSVFTALEAMRTGVPIDVAAAPLRQKLGISGQCASKAPVHIPTAATLFSALGDVVRNATDLRGELTNPEFASDPAWRSLADTGNVVDERARRALTDFDPIVASVYHVEHLVSLVANACPTWSAGSYRVKVTEGEHVTVQIVPRTEAEIARVAERGPTTYEVTLEPRIVVEPALAFAAFGAPRATYTTYATRPITGGTEIYEAGTRDQRFALGATLGFTGPWLDRRETKGIALWLPELAVGVSGGRPVLGVGPALSWNRIKVGVGALWVSRQTLHAAKVGDVLKAGTEVPLDDSFAKPQFFLSVAAFGLDALGLGGK
jgi:hypothetical protein